MTEKHVRKVPNFSADGGNASNAVVGKVWWSRSCAARRVHFMFQQFRAAQTNVQALSSNRKADYSGERHHYAIDCF